MTYDLTELDTKNIIVLTVASPALDKPFNSGNIKNTINHPTHIPTI